jgi:hypothetical protein
MALSIKHVPAKPRCKVWQNINGQQVYDFVEPLPGLYIVYDGSSRVDSFLRYENARRCVASLTEKGDTP